jgi:transcriptional regulator with XRE-family HTH domain
MTFGELGQRLKRLRSTRKWAVEDLSRKAGVPAHIITMTESGEHVPSLANTIRLARALRVDVAPLLDAREREFGK